MVLRRLQFVVTLAVVALHALCLTAKVTARASGAGRTSTQGPDMVPLITLRRRWPVRLLMPSPTASAAEKFAHSFSEKQLLPDEVVELAVNQAQTATHLFNTHKVKDADVQTFFKSPHFMNWEKAVKAEFGDKADELIFATMFKEFNARDNVAIEAIIARAIENPDTRALGVRFEDLLLNRLVGGVTKGETDDMGRYLRYLVYRDSNQNTVNEKMGRKMDGDLLISHLEKLKADLNDPENPYQNLVNYFAMISGGRKVADVFKGLHPVEGFNNDAFLFEKLFQWATKNQKDVDFSHFMLTTLQEEGMTESEIENNLPKLQHVFSSQSFKEMLTFMADFLPNGIARNFNLEAIENVKPKPAGE